MMNSYQHMSTLESYPKKRKISIVQSNYTNNVILPPSSTNELIFPSDSNGFAATKTRSKKGCFTCRKRKKKCNEGFPVCSGCARNFLQCCWPSTNEETLPRNFEIKPIGSSTKANNTTNVNTNSSNAPTPAPLAETPATPSISTNYFDCNSSMSYNLTNANTRNFDNNNNNNNNNNAYSINGKNSYDTLMYIDPVFSGVDSTFTPNTPSSTAFSILPEIRTIYNSNNELDGEDYDIPISFCSTIELNSYKHSLPFPKDQIPKLSSMEITLSFNSDKEVAALDEEYASSDDNVPSSPCLSELSMTTVSSPAYRYVNHTLDSENNVVANYGSNNMGMMGMGNTPDFSASVSDMFSSLFNTINSYKFQWIPDVQLNDEDAMLYQEFVTTYIPTISPSHSHPLLSPESVFVPQASRSAALREIFYTCGASILALKKPDQYSKIASKHYLKAIDLIQREIKSSTNITEDWLFVAVQTLCLLDRSMGLGANRCAKHLIAAYDIIKERETLKLKKIEKNGAERDSIAITANERSLFDSFVFNYVITIYFCQFEDLVQLPSPFTFFDDYNNYLTYTIYKDETSPTWTNSPIMGSATNCFECLGRLFWLLRNKQMNQIDDIDFKAKLNTTRTKINAALRSLKTYEAQLATLENQQMLVGYNESLGEADNSSKQHYKSSLNKYYKGNLEISKVIYESLEIFYLKLSNTNLDANNDMIQYHVDSLISEFAKIPELDHSKCLAISSLFIAGCAAVTLKQKEFISKELYVISSVLNTNIGIKLANKLEEFWFNDLKISEFHTFDVLISREGLEGLSF